MSVNWERPIEAVHEDGRVVAMRLNPRGSDISSVFTRTLDAPDDAESNEYWNEDGTDRVKYSGWRIRNVGQDAPETGAGAPSDVSGYPDGVVARTSFLRGLGWGLRRDLSRWLVRVMFR